MSRGGARARNGNFYAVTRYGKRQQLELKIPWATSEDDARERSELLAEAADSLVAVGRRDLVRPFARELAEASNLSRLAKVQKAIAKIVSGEERLASTGDVIFEDWARRYTSGELAELYPDHVKAKDYADDASRLRLYILPHVKDVPVRAFALEHADRVMAKLPKMSPANRRHVAQVIARLMRLAVFPGKLIAASPIPEGWLPKVKRERDYSCLFPREEGLLLAGDASEAFRLFCGVLNREGMRLSELLDCEEWQWGDDCRTFRTTKTKTDDPRMWKVRDDVAAAMRVWRVKRDIDMTTPAGQKAKPFAYVLAMGDRTKIAERFRDALKGAGVTRAELFETTEHTGQLRAHDMRATFVTISLAEGKTDTWIRDRTAHKSTSMIDRYRRHARQLVELEVGSLVELVGALGWSSHRIPSSGPGVAGRRLDDPSKRGSGKDAEALESTEGGTRTLTPRGRRILNTLAGSEEPPIDAETGWIATPRSASKRASSHLPATPSRPLAPRAAEQAGDVEGSTSIVGRTRLEVDGELVAATREGTAEQVAGELAEEMQRLGVPAAAVGAGVRVGSVPAEVSTRLQKCQPDRESVDLVTAAPAVTKGPAKARAPRHQAGERRKRSGDSR